MAKEDIMDNDCKSIVLLHGLDKRCLERPQIGFLFECEIGAGNDLQWHGVLDYDLPEYSLTCLYCTTAKKRVGGLHLAPRMR